MIIHHYKMTHPKIGETHSTISALNRYRKVHIPFRKLIKCVLTGISRLATGRAAEFLLSTNRLCALARYFPAASTSIATVHSWRIILLTSQGHF